MTKKQISDLGPLEFSLLKVLWELKEASSREILEMHNRENTRPLAYTTVATLLTRMEEKGVVEAEKSRQPYLFKPSVSRDQLIGQRIRDFVQTFFGGEPIDLAVRLVEDHPLTDESVEQLENALKKLKSGKPKN